MPISQINVEIEIEIEIEIGIEIGIELIGGIDRIDIEIDNPVLCGTGPLSTTTIRLRHPHSRVRIPSRALSIPRQIATPILRPRQSYQMASSSSPS